MTDDAPPIPHVPDRLGGGRYVLRERLGAGGMGLVYRATDTRLQRPVAVKLLGDTMAADERARERFAREARSAARLTHGNVVQVYDVGEEAGRPYLVMELVEGVPLSERVAEGGPLAPGEVLGIAADALAGLAAAHEAGVLHRDLKPGNLLEPSRGPVKITDFGIAVAADDARVTRTGMVVGTPGYLAPERRQGEQATVATDLYALGASLHHLLTGRPPESDVPLELPAGAPPGLRHLLEACLAADPARRPESASAAVDLLDRDAAPTPPMPVPAGSGQLAPAGPGEADGTRVQSPPPGGGGAGTEPVTPAHEGGGRRSVPAWILLAAAGAVVAALGVGLAVTTDGREPAPTDPAGPAVRPAEDPAETAERLAEWIRRQVP